MNRYVNQLQGVGSPAPNDYLQGLQQKLEEAQRLQKQLMTNPMGMLQQPQPQPAQQQTQVPPNASPEGLAVLQLFEEFALTEDGKQLVSYMGKFNSFCQSKVAKSGGN